MTRNVPATTSEATRYNPILTKKKSLKFHGYKAFY